MKYLSMVVIALMVIAAGTAKTVYVPDGVVRSEPTELESFLTTWLNGKVTIPQM